MGKSGGPLNWLLYARKNHVHSSRSTLTIASRMEAKNRWSHVWWNHSARARGRDHDIHAVHAYALTKGKDRSSSEQQLVQRQIIHKHTSVISQLHTILPEIDLNIAHTFCLYVNFQPKRVRILNKRSRLTRPRPQLKAPCKGFQVFFFKWKKR